MSLHHLGKHKPWKLCLFSHAVYSVSKTTLRTLLRKFPEHAVDFFFSDEKVFTVASPVNVRNDRVNAPSNVKLRDIASERLLRCRPTFSRLLVADGVRCCLETGCTELFFVELGMKVDGRY